MSMKRTSTLVLLLLFIAGLGSLLTQARQEQEPKFKLVQFHMALLKLGPKWNGVLAQEASPLHKEHVAYVKSLFETGKAIAGGPFADDGEILGVFIFRAKSPEEAKTWVEGDPAVKSEQLTAEMHPWWSENVMKKPSTPLKFTTAYFAFLERGPKWTPEKTPETEALQKAHLANINRLAQMKKLVVAGPFGDNGPLRGIFVFKVGSLEEAKALAATDPAVQAGRLVIRMRSWQVPEGILP